MDEKELETYRSGLVQLAGRVKDERALRRAWMVLNRRADAEEHPRRRNNPEAPDYRGPVIDLLYKIDDQTKLKTIFEVTHSVFLRS